MEYIGFHRILTCRACSIWAWEARLIIKLYTKCIMESTHAVGPVSNPVKAGRERGILFFWILSRALWGFFLGACLCSARGLKSLFKPPASWFNTGFLTANLWLVLYPGEADQTFRCVSERRGSWIPGHSFCWLCSWANSISVACGSQPAFRSARPHAGPGAGN